MRESLINQDNETLDNLATKSKSEIQTFLINERRSVKESEKQEQEEKSERIETKLSKIKSVFTDEILNNNPDIAKNFKALNLAKSPEEKEAILQGILTILKEP